ncbi:MAG: hypothetical protein ACSLE0_14245 [Chitinophagaceae bacterium]
MANTIIQKKTHPSYFILTTLGIVALLMVFSNCSTNKNTKSMGSTDLINVRENNSIVAAYISYVNDNNTMVPDHQYINNALVKLADASNAMAGEAKYTITGDLNMAKMNANKITQDPNETNHSDNIRKSADILAGVLQNLQMSKYSTLTSQAAELKNVAASIKPDILAHHQKDAIMSFFTKSASLLERMN